MTGAARPQSPNAMEQRILSAVRLAAPAEFTAADDGKLPEVSADFIRRLLLGLSIEGADHAAASGVRLTGVRVRGVRVIGPLELGDCTTESGGPLPPLLLERCELPDLVDLSGAYIARLSLNHSRFTELRAHGVRIVGGLDFGHATGLCEPANGRSATGWIDIRGAQIGGDIEGNHAVLSAPPARSSREIAGQPRFALRLSVSVVQGRMALNFVTAVGGISIADSDIRGAIWLKAAKLTAVESAAFLARNAHLRSSLYLSAEGDRQFEALGPVRLTGVQIAGSLNCDDATFEHVQERGGKIALDIENGEIGGNVRLCGKRFKMLGVATLKGARIGGDLECADAKFLCHDGTVINATNVDVRGQLSFRRSIVVGRIALWNGKIGHGFHGDCARFVGGIQKKHAGVAIDAANLEVVGDLNIRRADGMNAYIVGRANFARTSVTGNLNWEGLRFEESYNFEGIELRPQKGAVLDLRHSRIGPQLVAKDMQTQGKLDVQLSGAKVASLADQWPAGWGGQDAINRGLVSLALDGFSYQGAEALKKGNAKQWATDHLKWLELHPINEGFSPFAYRQLARVLREHGHEPEARAVAIREKERSPSEGVIGQSVKLAYRYGFGFGLSPTNAFITLTTLIVIGWAGSTIALNSGHLVSNSPPPSIALIDASRRAVSIKSVAQPQVLDIPCGNKVIPFYYAVDLMLPFIPLHQESKCDVADGPAHDGWRLAKFIFSLMGKLVTTLAFLTFSGVLKNRDQQ